MMRPGPDMNGFVGAVDDDTICALDGRARVEQKKIIVRRLDVHGSVDMDPKPDTGLGCNLPKDDYRVVEATLGHLVINLPEKEGAYPTVEGHVRARAPIPLIGRTGPDAPLTEGWAGLDVELRYTPETIIPNLTGSIQVRGIRVKRFMFGNIDTDVNVSNGVVTVKLLKSNVGGSETEIHDIEVRPLAEGIPIKVGDVDGKDINFTTLLANFHVHPRPFVTWDVHELRITNVHGTADPLKIDGDINARHRTLRSTTGPRARSPPASASLACPRRRSPASSPFVQRALPSSRRR